MDQDCIFCQIVRGKAPASIVYDDAGIVAFMNRFQSVPGHVLIVPRAHVENIYVLDDALACSVFVAASKDRAGGEAGVEAGWNHGAPE